MSIQTVLSCPLGHKCEEIRDGAIQRCAWFITLAGTNPSTGETVDEKGCAMSWTPVLLVENARVSRGTSAAVESFRNEMVNANVMTHMILSNQGRGGQTQLLDITPQ